MVGVDEPNFGAIDQHSLSERQGENQLLGNFEALVEESGGGGGAVNDAGGPLRREAGVVIGVEVGEEVRDGESGVGVLEAVDDEAGEGDEFGMG